MVKFEQIICLEQVVEFVEKQVDGVFKFVINLEMYYLKMVIIIVGNGVFKLRKFEFELVE